MSLVRRAAPRPGRVLGIVGANGSGKSTLLRTLLLLERPLAGDIRFGDLSLNKLKAEQLKELRKRTERRAAGVTRTDRREIKNGPGGIRDIETVVQFHQLLHAGHEREVLHGNTLQALQRLQRARALSADEHEALLKFRFCFTRVLGRCKRNPRSTA